MGWDGTDGMEAGDVKFNFVAKLAWNLRQLSALTDFLTSFGGFSALGLCTQHPISLA